jgi:hypothetical protein
LAQIVAPESETNVPRLLSENSIDEYERRQFIVMELLEGQTLKHRIAGQAIERERAAELGLRRSG